MIAEMLNVDVEDLYDLTLDQISELTVQIADDKVEIINEILNKRTVAHDTIKTAQKDYGITSDDLSYIYFEDLKKGE